jgi:hypothetical protein
MMRGMMGGLMARPFVAFKDKRMECVRSFGLVLSQVALSKRIVRSAIHSGIVGARDRLRINGGWYT